MQCSFREAHAWHLLVGYGCFTPSLSSADPAPFLERETAGGEGPVTSCSRRGGSRVRKRGEREGEGRGVGFDWWVGAEMAFCPLFCWGKGLDR